MSEAREGQDISSKDKSKLEMVKITVFVSKYHYKKITELSDKLDMIQGRLVAIAIDNELEKPEPFKIDLTLPEDVLPHTYADEVGKLVRYLRKIKYGLSLDALMIARHDMGIPSREAFLGAVKEALDNEFIQKYTKVRMFTKNKRPFIAYAVRRKL